MGSMLPYIAYMDPMGKVYHGIPKCCGLSSHFPRVVAISTFQKRLHGGPKQRKTSRKIWPF